MYLLPYCDLIQSIYYIYHDKRLGYQWWHRPSKMATAVYEREIGGSVGTRLASLADFVRVIFPYCGDCLKALYTFWVCHHEHWVSDSSVLWNKHGSKYYKSFFAAIWEMFLIYMMFANCLCPRCPACFIPERLVSCLIQQNDMTIFN